jgi:hypothetical protein
MRTTAIPISTALSLILAASAYAQTGNNLTITAPEVEVRSGPSPEFPATTVLKQGSPVQVVESESKITGWVAIRPTRWDFSWVDSRFVEQQKDKTAIVKTPEGTWLWVGRRPVQQSPTVRRVQVKQGTILSVLDRAWTSSEGITWVPVAPYQTEVRYIPESAVKPALPPESSVFASQPAPAPNVVAARPTTLSPRVDQLMDQAEKADRAGNLNEAISLYQQVAREAQDEGQRIRVLNRAQYLRTQPAAMSPAASTAVAASYTSTGQGQTGSQYCYTPDRYSTAQSQSPANVNLAAPPAPPAGQWYGPGIIRRAPFDVDGRPTYRVEPRDLSKQMWWYVTAGPGVNFEPYVDRPNAYVYLFGPMTYRTDVRIWYMNVLRVDPTPR